MDKTINDKLANNVMRLIEQAEKDSYRQGIEEGLKYNFDHLMNQIDVNVNEKVYNLMLKKFTI